MFRQIGILWIIIVTAFIANGQDTLPSFTLVNKGNNHVIVSWTNRYGAGIRQLTIQRSPDSTKNFKSILTLPDPTVPQNGYADSKAPAPQMFYRLFILLDSGKYVFSKAKRPVWDTAKQKGAVKDNNNIDQRIQNDPRQTTDNAKTVEKNETIKPKEIPERIIYIKRLDTVITQIGERSLKRFKDSLLLKTKDTLSFNTADTIIIKPFVPKEVYKPSRFVFTEKDGNVKIALPDAATKKYTLKFYDDDNQPVFEVKQIKDKVLIIDKSNFIHAGWFKFELMEDGQLKEKHKLYIPKEF